MAHCTVKEAEEILDKEFPVLDKGFVRLLDYLGGDERVVQAARVSYGGGTKGYREDAALIDYLLRNQHTSPFEQVVLSFHIKLPIFVARQWIRHRTARLNEISGRYSVLKEEFYVPAMEDVSYQSRDNKQGRSEESMPANLAQEIREAFSTEQGVAYTAYDTLVHKGLAKELARINLPLSLYTEWYWQIDLHNLFHFINLRLDPHAQREIRAYAQVLLDLTRKVAPRCCASFESQILGGVRFSSEEFAELKRRLSSPDGIGITVKEPTLASATLDTIQEPRLSGKALERFEAKLKTGRQQ